MITNVGNVVEDFDHILVRMMRMLDVIDSLKKEVEDARASALPVCSTFNSSIQARGSLLYSLTAYPPSLLQGHGLASKLLQNERSRLFDEPSLENIEDAMGEERGQCGRIVHDGDDGKDV